MVHIDQLLNTWNSVLKSSADSTEDFNVNLSKCEDRNVLRFFWLDAYPLPSKPGTIILFGKSFKESTLSYITTSVVVRNIQRTIYLLPRSHFKNDPTKKVHLRDVYEEFKATIAVSHLLHSFEARPVFRNFINDPEVPSTSEYLEVKYAFTYPVVRLTEGNTYSKIFGKYMFPLETFLLERKIEGPCWLDIVDATREVVHITYCDLEYNCYKATNVSITKCAASIRMPPLVVASINLKWTSSDLDDQIIMITCMTHKQYRIENHAPQQLFQQYFCLFVCPRDVPLPIDFCTMLKSYNFSQVEIVDNESTLLSCFISKLAKLDPDIIVGHDLYGGQMNLLHKRLRDLDIKSFSKCGRFGAHKKMPNLGKFVRQGTCGRWLCDIKIFTDGCVQSSYDLHKLCKKVLDVESFKILPNEISGFYKTSVKLITLIVSTLLDTAFILALMYRLNIIPISLSITNVCGNLMSRTLLGGTSERIEFLLLHAFHDRDYIIPELWRTKQKVAELYNAKAPSHLGGLVLTPKSGLYDTLVLYMDFKSLYPSIIQEYNVCFSTFLRDQQDNAVAVETSGLGILPSIVKSLIDRRDEIKKMMVNLDHNSNIYVQLNIQQLAVKLLANGLYGYLSFSKSRFRAAHLAAFITKKGRDILMYTKHLIEEMSYEVIYGDTDSLMIKTDTLNFDEALKIGTAICKHVNRHYRHIVLKIEDVFKNLLLLKKKRYAAVSVTKCDNEIRNKYVYVGLDIVRHDCSKICSDIGETVLRNLLSDLPQDKRSDNIKTYLSNVAKEFREMNDVHFFAIMQELVKDASEYSTPDNHAHVRIALRMNKVRKQITKGQIVPYVICRDGTNRLPHLRAYHIDEFKNTSSLKIDYEYYLRDKIFCIVSRLCNATKIIDDAQIAACLGISLDRLAVKQVRQSTVEIRQEEYVENKFDSFIFRCYLCHTENPVTETTATTFLEQCANTSCSFKLGKCMYHIQNQLTLALRALTQKLYLSEMLCDNIVCNFVTHYVPLRTTDEVPLCSNCNHGRLRYVCAVNNVHSRLMYLKNIFSLLSASVNQIGSPVLFSECMKLKQTVAKTLHQYKYNTVHLYDLFAPLTSERFDRHELIWTVLEADFMNAEEITDKNTF